MSLKSVVECLGVSAKSEGCFNEVRRVFQQSLKFQGSFKVVLKNFLECFKED